MMRAVLVLALASASCRAAGTTSATSSATAALTGSAAEPATGDPAGAKVMKVRHRKKRAEFIAAECALVSARGIYVSAPREVLTVGTLVKLVVAVDDDPALIEALGRVVWTGAPGGALPGMGIQFVQVSRPTKTFLAELIAQRRALGQPAKYELGFPEGQRLTSEAQEDQLLANLRTP
jgi:hypothetical protein